MNLEEAARGYICDTLTVAECYTLCSTATFQSLSFNKAIRRETMLGLLDCAICKELVITSNRRHCDVYKRFETTNHRMYILYLYLLTSTS